MPKYNSFFILLPGLSFSSFRAFELGKERNSEIVAILRYLFFFSTIRHVL